MNKPSPEILIQGKTLSLQHPTYFIADIAANHDGELSRAQDLIYLAAEAGADAAKFQHFTAETIVSNFGFKSLGSRQSHQTKWKKSVFDVYKDASLNVNWTPALKDTCDKAGITFLTSPYSLDLVDQVDPYVPAYKIGSGDITWLEIVRHICSKKKPVLLATGASTLQDVQRAVNMALEHTNQLILMQCNTNYTASLENFRYIQLNVLNTYRQLYPNLILGLSDHTPGHATVLGAVTLGARAIEKHFTDDTTRLGPDHAFSMDPRSWKDMVLRTRELENALGNGAKNIEGNEQETVILQRRALRCREGLKEGTTLQAEQLVSLRPCPPDAIEPYQLENVVGRRLTRTLEPEQHLRWNDLN